MSSPTAFDFFAPCPRGLEAALAAELAEIAQRLPSAAGAPRFEAGAQVPGGVHFRGGWAEGMAANLHSRIASRVLLKIAERPYRNEQDIYALAAEQQGRIQAAQADWGQVMAARTRKFWLRPPTAPDDFSCTVAMQLAPDGQVQSARVVSSCGDPQLDRSVEAAVIKASPMPLPPDPKAFVPNVTVNFTPHAG